MTNESHCTVGKKLYNVSKENQFSISCSWMHSKLQTKIEITREMSYDTDYTDIDDRMVNLSRSMTEQTE